MRLGLIVASVAAAGVARADQMAPPEPISVARGVVARVVDVQLGATTRFAVVEWRDLQEDTPPAELPPYTDLVPFQASACARVYAYVASAKGWKTGQTTHGLVVPGGRRGSGAPITLPWCEVIVGAPDQTDLPTLTELARTEGDAILPGLDALSGFFGPPLADAPIASPVEQALAELKSDAGLTFALDQGLTYLASRHFRWRTDPAMFDVVERAMWTKPWTDGRPDMWITDLYWQLSPARAAARTRTELAADPARGKAAVSTAPAWDEVLALRAELGLGAAIDGDERSVEVMRAELATTTQPYLRGLLEERIARIDDRVRRGVVDGASLARYLRSHRDDADLFRGMHLTVVGPEYLGCDIHLPIGRIELRVEVDCDAETLRHGFDRPDGDTITAKGIVEHIYVGSDYVEIRLDVAHVTPGGTPVTAAFDAGPAADARTAAFDVEAERPRRKDGGGCGCGAGGDGGIALALVVLALLRRRDR